MWPFHRRPHCALHLSVWLSVCPMSTVNWEERGTHIGTNWHIICEGGCISCWCGPQLSAVVAFKSTYITKLHETLHVIFKNNYINIVMFQMKELCSQGVYVGSSSFTYLGNPSMGECSVVALINNWSITFWEIAFIFVDQLYNLAWPRSFAVSGPSVWNKLPATLRVSLTLGQFQSKLKAVLFRSACETWIGAFVTA